MAEQQFRLSVTVQVQETDEHGHPRSYGGPGLRVEQNIDLGPLNFMGLASVLNQFHRLGEEIKATRGKVDPGACDDRGCLGYGRKHPEPHHRAANVALPASWAAGES